MDCCDERYCKNLLFAGDIKESQQAMDETFYLSNIVPQNIQNNADFWHRMEVYCRSLAKRFSDVYVISGPLFLPCTTKEDGYKYVKYQVYLFFFNYISGIPKI